jgi:Xaa-Pro aminopeptidase
MTNPLNEDEYALRRENARQFAEQRGLDALVICGRGGGTVDRYANVFYLTNFYSSFPYIPDEPGHWQARAHSYVVLPVKGDATLIADLPSIDTAQIPRDHIVVTEDVTGALVQVIRECGLENATLGLVGEDTMPVSHFRAFERELPKTTWRNADDILTGLRAHKSAGEIQLLRTAADIGSRVIEAMMDAAEPGVLHGQVVAAGMQPLMSAGGVLYNAFMASGTGGENPTLVRNSFPTWGAEQRLVDGQWFRMGLSGVVGGYYFDVSRSKPIGGPSSNAQIDAFEAAIDVVQTGISAAKLGAPASDIATAAIAKQRSLGYPIEGVFSGLGHGIGLGWDSPWLIPDESMTLQQDMVINVERTLTRDGYLGDFEETILITDDGPELLTNARLRYW